jgi:riboflavin synthase
MEKISLYRLAATMPWAEVETTQHNIRITVYEGSEEDCEKTVLVVNPKQAAELAKAMDILLENYCNYKRRNK